MKFDNLALENPEKFMVRLHMNPINEKAVKINSC